MEKEKYLVKRGFYRNVEYEIYKVSLYTNNKGASGYEYELYKESDPEIDYVSAYESANFLGFDSAKTIKQCEQWAKSTIDDFLNE